jgi:hypothetical protein
MAPGNNQFMCFHTTTAPVRFILTAFPLVKLTADRPPYSTGA